jgi:hypothetical protein
MWIIKNRITGEYDTKGLFKPMDKLNRSSWGTLGQAKCHVAQKITACYRRLQFLDWYLDADYMEIDETGTLNTIPVIEHLKIYLKDNHYNKYLTEEQGTLLGLEVTND